jgi:hypothetical protein
MFGIDQHEARLRMNSAACLAGQRKGRRNYECGPHIG